MTVLPLDRLFVSGRDSDALVAVRDHDRLSFGQFAADVAHIAGNARAMGVARGAVLSTDPYRFLTGLFGLMHAGAEVVVPPDGLPGTLASLGDAFDTLLCDETPPIPVRTLSIREGRPGTATLGALDPAAAMLTFFTSGSSGEAKPIVKPLAMFNAEAATLEASFGSAAGGSPVVTTVPHRHIFGLTFHLLWPLARGQPFASHVDELWETLLARDTADAVLVTSPAHLRRLAGIVPLPRERRLARVFTAGAPLHPDQAREAANVLGVLPTEIFGSTETGAIATRAQQTGNEAWTPLRGIAVRTSDDGCMIVHSPYGPDGAPFVSADRIETMPDGTFHFLGRADRVAKIEGKRVSLARLEDELVALPLVTEAAALVLGGAPERLAAAVVLTAEGRIQLGTLGNFRFGRDLRRQLAQVLESPSLPKSWRFVEGLPRTAMGKRRDADIRALFTPSPTP
jgi:acyl-coenzyme A synthetase/AMP-(fatty) acid ligase